MKKTKKVVLIALSYVLAIGLAIGGTVAWLTSTDEDVNVMTLGKVKIDQLEYERVVDEDGKWVSTGKVDKYGYTADKVQEYTQAKPLLPAVFKDGDIKWDDRNGSQDASGATSHQQSWGEIGAPGSNQLFDDSVRNVQDKFVFVKNTGKSDAYVRTWFAFEQGGVAAEDFSDVIMTNTNADHWSWETVATDVEIDGNTYVVKCATYLGPKSNPTGILAPDATTYASLLQVYMRPEATNEDVDAIDGNANGTYDILVFSQAVQTDGFDAAEEALDAAFGDASVATHPWADGHVALSSVDTSEDFAAAVTADKKTIVVNLEGDVTYDVAAWDKNAMGSENTETIVINGNGHTITFNQKDSDWNNVTTNGAKLVINNANITSSGYNNGPWNRHDLNFACDVELNNVKSDKAIALKAAGTLNNVIINDANTSDTYALWIQPNGQTVTLTGCTIDMLDCTDGRGIKIDEQYVDAPEKVTLVVNDTTFKTEEKSAILVKSVAGADVIINNVDISGVVADSTNAVWVDEASAAYADLVTVTGATKIVEP
ncbi:MAG: hypothetical protein IJ389_05575 [Clostridia bacterium]|nr:hypothetical protein [Clostridia bacterium]